MLTIETPPEKQNPPHRPRAQTRTAPRRSREDRWWRRGRLTFGVIAIVASGAALIATAVSTPQTGLSLTHTITRGNLLVTVIAQGSLESAENTVIRCKVRGQNTVIWVVESGTVVKPGDVLVRLDTLLIEEQITAGIMLANWTRSSTEQSKANLTRREVAVSVYEQGIYVSELMTLEKDLAIAESRQSSAKNMLSHTQLMAKNGYASELEVEEKKAAVLNADLAVDISRTQIDVLKRFTKKERQLTLKGNLASNRAQLNAYAQGAMVQASRLDRALGEFENCVVEAEKGGLVIHPSATGWENAPEIFEGATVNNNQVLLLMPDLSQMQVKVGIHESVIDRMEEGLPARLTLPNKTLHGKVASVASVSKPPGWWTANEVRYETVIQLPPVEGLRPGMSADVEVIIARYEDVLTIPVAAIIESDESNLCWVTTPRGTERRELVLGDSNDVFTVVEEGLKEGDEVVLNPLALREAQAAATKMLD